jgi:hypothetical protein
MFPELEKEQIEFVSNMVQQLHENNRGYKQ